MQICALWPTGCKSRFPLLHSLLPYSLHMLPVIVIFQPSNCKFFSLIEFFKKMKKWADMASLPQRFRDKVERLERNFAVSTVTFKKFEPIFLDIFRSPGDDPVRPPKGRKQKCVFASFPLIFIHNLVTIVK